MKFYRKITDFPKQTVPPTMPPIVPNSPDNGELDDKGSAKQAQ